MGTRLVRHQERFELTFIVKPKKRKMGVFKEEAWTFEEVARKQQRIFADACDYGLPYNTGNPPAEILMLIESVKQFQELDKKYPDEKKFIRHRQTWEGGVEVTIRIGWEIDEGMECGTEYVISYCFIAKRYEKDPCYLHKGCDAYISVYAEAYREPHRQLATK